MTQQQDLGLIPAPASSAEVLAREPNSYADATTGPDPQISPSTWVHWTKPDGDEFIAPLANDETYARKGYTRGAEETIDSLPAYWAEQAGGAHVEERKQTPEEVVARMAGVPKTPEEVEAEQKALEEERAANVAAQSQPPQPEPDPNPPPQPEPDPNPPPAPEPSGG